MRMLAQHIWWCLGDSQNVCFSLVSQRCFDERTWVFWLGAMEICALVLSQRWERRSFLRWENEKMLDFFNQFSKQQLWIWTSSYVRVFWDRWRLWFGVIAATIKTNVFAIGKRENAGFFKSVFDTAIVDLNIVLRKGVLLWAMEIVIWCHSSDQKDVHLCDGQWENAGLFKLVFDTAVVDFTSCYVRVFWERWRLWFGVTAAIRKTFICAMAQWENAGFFKSVFATAIVDLWTWHCGLGFVYLVSC